MNVRKGDLAYITRSPYLGHLVEVLYASPMGHHTLPDGYPAISLIPNLWVCKSLSSPFYAHLNGVSDLRKCMYAQIKDEHLRPIRPGEGQDETLTWLDVPGEVHA